MKTIESIKDMTAYSNRLHDQGDRIGFVPTMGFLHEGHLSLMRKAREENHALVASIFVNPTQFGPNEDFESYPREMESDTALCKEEGCDILFNPSAGEMYPEGHCTTVSVSHLTDGLCGASRPGHFNGVTTVVLKLFNIVNPHQAYFGLKDYQQFRVIEKMVTDLDMDMKVIGLPTIREADGLAMSSRNTYLSPDERQSALSLSRSLEAARLMIKNSETDGNMILKKARKIIENEAHTRIDYLELVDAQNLQPVDRVEKDALLVMAVYVGKARLIDNAVLSTGNQ